MSGTARGGFCPLQYSGSPEAGWTPSLRLAPSSRRGAVPAPARPGRRRWHTWLHTANWRRQPFAGEPAEAGQRLLAHRAALSGPPLPACAPAGPALSLDLPPLRAAPAAGSLPALWPTPVTLCSQAGGHSATWPRGGLGGGRSKPGVRGAVLEQAQGRRGPVPWSQQVATGPGLSLPPVKGLRPCLLAGWGGRRQPETALGGVTEEVPPPFPVDLGSWRGGFGPALLPGPHGTPTPSPAQPRGPGRGGERRPLGTPPQAQLSGLSERGRSSPGVLAAPGRLGDGQSQGSGQALRELGASVGPLGPKLRC